MRALFVAVCLATLTVTPTLAQEPVGCDKFKWPIEKEMAALREPNLKAVACGSNVSVIPLTMAVIPTQ